jgi:hypothetical protein
LNNIEIESKRELNKINNEYKNQINSMTFQHNIQREHQKQEFQNDINAINYQFQNYWLNIINNFCTYYSSRFNNVNNNRSF